MIEPLKWLNRAENFEIRSFIGSVWPGNSEIFGKTKEFHNSWQGILEFGLWSCQQWCYETWIYKRSVDPLYFHSCLAFHVVVYLISCSNVWQKIINSIGQKTYEFERGLEDDRNGNFCHGMILVPRVAVRLCPGDFTNPSWLYWRAQEKPDL